MGSPCARIDKACTRQYGCTTCTGVVELVYELKGPAAIYNTPPLARRTHLSRDGARRSVWGWLSLSRAIVGRAPTKTGLLCKQAEYVYGGILPVLYLHLVVPTPTEYTWYRRGTPTPLVQRTPLGRGRGCHHDLGLSRNLSVSQAGQ